LGSDGDTIRSKFFKKAMTQKVESACFSPDSTEILVFGGGFGPGTSQRVTIDTSFNIISIDTFYYKVNSPYEVQNYNQGYIVCSEFTSHTPSQVDDVWVFSADSLFGIVDEVDLITEDTLDGPAYFHPLDYIDPNKIFVGVLHDVYLGFNPTEPSWIMLYRLNADLEVEMCRYFGGDEFYYKIFSVNATTDGGVLLLCTKYDYNQDAGINEDIYLLKVDQDGLLTDLVWPDFELSKNAVYPNPGIDYFILETDDYLELRVCNSVGKIVFHDNLIKGKNIIGTTHWPSGHYVYFLTNNKNLWQSGKWIKN
jgi:hypothetical protein